MTLGGNNRQATQWPPVTNMHCYCKCKIHISPWAMKCILPELADFCFTISNINLQANYLKATIIQPYCKLLLSYKFFLNDYKNENIVASHYWLYFSSMRHAPSRLVKAFGPACINYLTSRFESKDLGPVYLMREKSQILYTQESNSVVNIQTGWLDKMAEWEMQSVPWRISSCSCFFK